MSCATRVDRMTTAVAEWESVVDAGTPVGSLLGSRSSVARGEWGR
jgi:hypothetical protein